MRVSLDLTVATTESGGIGRYVEQLSQALISGYPEVEWVLLPGRSEPPWLASLPGKAAVIRPAGQAKNRVVRANLALPGLLAAHGIDVHHAPDNLSLPLLAARRTARVVTIHDLIPILLPHTVEWKHRLITRVILEASVRRADAVIVPSEATRRDILERYPAAEGKVFVTPEGVDESFRPAPAGEVERVRRAHGLPGEYLLFLGTLEPKKNLPALLRAYAAARSRAPSLPPLVVAGKTGWIYEPIFETWRELRLQEAVRFLGFVPNADVVPLMSGARAFLFPSLYEGFGLPVLEAMACGTPVITSNVSSLPEVAGDAAITVDPHSVEELAHAIEKLAFDDTLHRALRERGLRRAAVFTWRRCAEQTMEVYRRVAR